jgi:outer membrane protein OmpA-like peptidoglycan-associated protein/tetratricopeptide (TPR) repeat protein
MSLSIALFIGGCTYVQKIKDGTTAFDRKQYKKAITMLKSEYKKEKSRVEKGKLAFYLGESYKFTNQSEEAIPWYMTAYENSYGTDALEEYAYALKRTQQYKEAIQAFKDLGNEIGSPYEYKREIRNCEIAMTWLSEETHKVYSIEKAKFNNRAADYSPSIYLGNALVFSSDRSESMGEEAYEWTGKDFMDLFVVDLNSNDVTPFEAPINSIHNEGSATFTRDFNEMFFIRCFGDENNQAFCKIMSSQKDGNSWTVPKVLSFIEPEVNYKSPAISDDGNTLYFAANHPDGWGGYDIYQVERTPAGWDIPKLLSRNVNTIGNELFPTIEADTLYFSSDFHAGMGGLDIFRVYKRNDREWSSAFNLKAPINSGADDFNYIVDYRAPIIDPKVIHKGYFTSTRDEGSGLDDIYAFVRRVPPPPPPPDTTKEVPPIVYKMILNGYVLEKIYEDPTNPNSRVLGRKPLNAAKVAIQIGGESQEVEVGEDGLFKLELEEKTDYNFFASKEGYLNNDERFTSKGISKDPNNPILEFEVEIVLDKIFKNKEIVLDNIYYDFNEAFIRNDAKPTLNELADLLSQNPTIKIELASHTDCRGKTKLNLDLSARRAQSAVDYLVSAGIEKARLSAKGYGKSAPAIPCVCARCTEEEHQSNRRTTFKIID